MLALLSSLWLHRRAVCRSVCLKTAWLKTLFAVAALVSGSLSFADTLAPIPTLNDPVMDTAQIMKPEAKNALSRHLRDFSRQKGSQIIVLTVPQVAPESTFDYGSRVMDTWKPGRKGVDDGVVLLIVKNERKTQILVGRGLEGAIPDAYAKRILDETLQPAFRAGQFDQGITAAASQLEKLINGEALPAPKGKSAAPQQGFSFANWMIIVLMVSVVLGRIFRAIFGRIFGSIATAGATGAIAMLLGSGLLLAVGLGLIVLFVSILFGGSSVFIPGGGGFGGGFGGGGFGGGSDSSGGGFSGGGGDFGGGGASGGW